MPQAALNLPVPARVGSFERFAQKAVAIVNATMGENTARNERSLALARSVMGVAFAARLFILYPEDMLAGSFKDWLVFIVALAIAAISVVHLARPDGGPGLPTRQRVFVGLDLTAFVISTVPAVVWPEPTYQGILMLPYAGIGALVAVAGGLRLDRRLALASSLGMLALFAGVVGLDLALNAERIRWGVAELAFYALELASAALLGVLISTRVIDLARESAAAAIDGERARERLGAYVGREVAEEALRSDAVVLGGVRQQVAVLFTDLRGFTRYAEKLPPEALVAELNAYLEEMVAVITAHGGVVDKYIGDGIMAVFGAPKTRDDDAIRALKTARALVVALEAHNRRREAAGRPPLQMGVGVHFGPVVAGNIGTLDHAQYTIIGDTVNLAARLEGATKDVGAGVLVSRAVKDAAGAAGEALVPLGRLAVRGREEAVEVFGLGDTARS